MTIAHIRDNASDEHQLITDLLEKIVLNDLSAEDPSVEELADGRCEVGFDVSARKFEAEGSGIETEVPIDTWVDIAVLGLEQGDAKALEVLFLEKRLITQSSQEGTIVVDQRPRSVGIDPINKLIDRNSSDNIVSIHHINQRTSQACDVTRLIGHSNWCVFKFFQFCLHQNPRRAQFCFGGKVQLAKSATNCSCHDSKLSGLHFHN